MAMCNLSDPVEDYRNAQAQQNEQHSIIKEQIAACDEEITAYVSEIDNLINARRMAKSEILKQRYDAQADDMARLVERLIEKRTNLSKQFQTEMITDEQIDNLANDLVAMSQDVDEADGNIEAQRK